MAATIWHIQAIDTQGADLVLSRIVPWGEDGEIVPVSIAASFTPSSGSVDNLLVDDDSECAFSARDVFAPSFLLTFTFSEPVDLWGFRFAGPSEEHWPVQHAIRAGELVADNKAVEFLAPGVLSPSPTKPAALGELPGQWVAQTATGNRRWEQCSLSADGRTIIAAVYSGAAPLNLWLSKDAGVTWVAQTAAGSRSWYGCAVSADGQTLLGAPYGGELHLSKDAGVTWVAQTAGGSRNWFCCAMSSDGQTLLAAEYAGSSNNIWLSKDGGATWVAQTAAGSRNWQRCAVSADGKTLMATHTGSSGNIWLSKDGGATWSAQTAAGSRSWYGCAVSADGQTLLGGADGGWLYLSKDGGATWVAQTAAGTKSWRGCGTSDDGQTLLAAAYSGDFYLWLSLDGGVTWTAQVGAGVENWHGCAVSGGGQVLVGSPAANSLLRVLKLPDPIYTDPPLQTVATQPEKVIDSEPLPQGLGPVSETKATQLTDVEFGGRGRIYGTVERKNTPSNVPMVRRVRLHRSKDGALARETWSKPDGSYEFRGINPNYEYDTIAWDHEMNYRSVVANNLKPEV